MAGARGPPRANRRSIGVRPAAVGSDRQPPLHGWGPRQRVCLEATVTSAAPCQNHMFDLGTVDEPRCQRWRVVHGTCLHGHFGCGDAARPRRQLEHRR